MSSMTSSLPAARVRRSSSEGIAVADVVDMDTGALTAPLASFSIQDSYDGTQDMQHQQNMAVGAAAKQIGRGAQMGDLPAVQQSRRDNQEANQSLQSCSSSRSSSSSSSSATSSRKISSEHTSFLPSALVSAPLLASSASLMPGSGRSSSFAGSGGGNTDGLQTLHSWRSGWLLSCLRVAAPGAALLDDVTDAIVQWLREREGFSVTDAAAAARFAREPVAVATEAAAAAAIAAAATTTAAAATAAASQRSLVSAPALDSAGTAATGATTASLAVTVCAQAALLDGRKRLYVDAHARVSLGGSSSSSRNVEPDALLRLEAWLSSPLLRADVSGLRCDLSACTRQWRGERTATALLHCGTALLQRAEATAQLERQRSAKLHLQHEQQRSTLQAQQQQAEQQRVAASSEAELARARLAAQEVEQRRRELLAEQAQSMLQTQLAAQQQAQQHAEIQVKARETQLQAELAALQAQLEQRQQLDEETRRVADEQLQATKQQLHTLREEAEAQRSAAAASEAAAAAAVASAVAAAAAAAADSAAAHGAGSNENPANGVDDDSSLCIVCFEGPRRVLLQPCLHLALCRVCADSFEHCPVCRTVIEQRISVHLP